MDETFGEQISLFTHSMSANQHKRMKGEVLAITPNEASNFLLPRHYSGRIPSISQAFGYIRGGVLQAVCTFGKPASNNLCEGVCGKEYSDRVYELNRLCRLEELEEPLSAFVSACLRRLRINRWIIVSYSDTAMNHHGYIYQACNFMYTGCTKERTDIWTGKHSRHYTEEEAKSETRVVRSSKHRYIYFCTYDKNEKQKWKEALRYPVLPYPKGDNNENYVLGQYLQPRLITKHKDKVEQIV